ncbi:MAG: metal ABC transporter solute-binding protein, Zn/Mn family [bacterium]
MIFRFFTFIALFFCIVSFNLSDVSAKENRKKVVVSFSILEDIVSVIGGKRVHVTSLVRRNMDLHMFQPTPRQAKIVSSADLVIMNGLGLEGWMERLVKASGYKGKTIVATDNIPKLKLEDDHDDHKKDDHGHKKDHDDHKKDDHGHKKDHDDHKKDDHGHKKDDHGHGEWDPHVWLSVPNMKIYVTNVAEAMSRMDPSSKTYYMKNLKKYMSDLDNLDKFIRRSVNSIPKKNRVVITSHEAFGHLSNEYGIEMLAPQGLSTETRASASKIASIVRFIKKHSVKAVFPENITDNRLIEQIAKQTKIKIGASLYSDALSEKNEPAGTYLNYMRYNVGTIVKTLK